MLKLSDLAFLVHELQFIQQPLALTRNWQDDVILIEPVFDEVYEITRLGIDLVDMSQQLLMSLHGEHLLVFWVVLVL